LFDHPSPSYALAANLKTEEMTSRRGYTSMLNENLPKEPLITKAYDAFRKNQSKDYASDFLPTDEYVEAMARRSNENKNPIKSL
jgi:hypothetical protein